MGRGQHAIDPILGDLLKGARDVAFVIEGKQQHVHAALHKTGAELREHLRVEIQIGYDHRHHIGAPRDQPARDGVGLVAERLHGFHNALAHFLGDAGARFEAARYGGLGHAGMPRHVVRGDVAPAFGKPLAAATEHPLHHSA